MHPAVADPRSLASAYSTEAGIPGASLDAIADELARRHGEVERSRIARGVRAVARRWTAAEGDAESLRRFAIDHFTPATALPALRDRLELGVSWIVGHLYEARRHLRRFTDLRGDRIAAVDDALATFDPAPDLTDQWYRQRLAFIVLLNLERPDLEAMLSEGSSWSVERWSEVRIAQTFGPRIPAALNERARLVGHAANRWVSEFHIPVGTLVDERGARPFTPGRKLIAHWLVREAIKAGYGDPEGLPTQRALAWVMARHIDGTIPLSVMEDRDEGDWDARANTVGGRPVAPERTVGLRRCEHWLARRDVAFAFDRHHPEHPSAIRRKCELEREIPEREVERILVELLDHPARLSLAAYLRRRLGRPLEAFDIYAGEFAKPLPIEALDARVRERFGDADGLERALPELLRSLGFATADAGFLAGNIRVEIARGAGHAVRPGIGSLPAWLRTNCIERGDGSRELGWDGFDTAMHELGHTVEQVISTHAVPRVALRGVPNTACTEAFAFLFQSLGRRVLGLLDEDEERRAFDLDAVQTFAAACQIAGPSLLELRVWNWMQSNPGAGAEDLRRRVLAIADELWAAHYARDFGPDPYRLLAAYQHMISHPLYLPDYALGHVIGHQIRSHVKTRDLATETRRICAIGRVTPDLWMRRAVGAGISPAVLAEDAAAALGRLD